MFTIFFVLSLIIGLIASFAPVFVFNNFSEYKNDVRTVMRLLENEGYSSQEIINILNFNEVFVAEPV